MSSLGRKIKKVIKAINLKNFRSVRNYIKNNGFNRIIWDMH